MDCLSQSVKRRILIGLSWKLSNYEIISYRGRRAVHQNRSSYISLTNSWRTAMAFQTNGAQSITVDLSLTSIIVADPLPFVRNTSGRGSTRCAPSSTAPACSRSPASPSSLRSASVTTATSWTPPASPWRPPRSSATACSTVRERCCFVQLYISLFLVGHFQTTCSLCWSHVRGNLDTGHLGWTVKLGKGSPLLKEA